MDSKQQKLIALLALFCFSVIAALFVPPIPQDPSFFDFADKRPWLGIPNFGDVASNIGFLIVGLLGLRGILIGGRIGLFTSAGDAIPYYVFFAAIAGVAAGSAYFHWEPNNDTLLWDRLPMTVAFMAFFAAVIADRIDRRAGLLLVPVLLAAGVASALYWYFSELAGQGDLRPYAVVQFFPMLAIPLMVWLFQPGHYTRGRDIAWIIALYALAKVLEVFDAEVFELVGQTVSGHTLKHLAAAGASYVLYRMVVTARAHEPQLGVAAG